MIDDWIARTLSFLAAVVIIAIAEPRINLMAPTARPVFRFAFIAMGTGAVWSILEVVAGTVPSWPAVLIRIGLAALLIEERRCPRNCARRPHNEVKIVRRARGQDLAEPPRA